MRLSENRPIAWAVLAVCVVGSVIGLGGGSAVKERADLVKQFNSGIKSEDTTRNGMDASLDRAAEQASIMANEAMILLEADNATAKEMIENAAIVGESADLDERYRAYTALQNGSDALYNAVYAKYSDAASKDKVKNFKHAYDDFWGADKYIKHDPYRENAAQFNSDISGFPANVITSLRGVKKLNSFGID